MASFRPWADVLADAQKSGASPEQIEQWRQAYNKAAPQYMAPLAPDPAAPKEEPKPPPDPTNTQTALDWFDRSKTAASEAYRSFKQPIEKVSQDVTKGLSSRAAVAPVRKMATRAAYGLHEAGLPISKEQAHRAGRAAEHIAREYAAPAVGGTIEYAPEMAALWASGGLGAAPVVGPYLAAAESIPYVGWIPSAGIVGAGAGMAKRYAQGRAQEVDPQTGQVIPPAEPEDIVHSARQGAKGFVEAEGAARALGFAIRAPLKMAGIDWFEGSTNRPESEGHGSKAKATPPVEERPSDTDDDDDGGGGGERGASGGSEVNTKKEQSDPGLAARNERTDKPGSGAGGTDPDDDGTGGGGGGARVGGPTSRTVPPAVNPEGSERDGVPSQPVGPGSSDQKATPETGEPKPRYRLTPQPETPESRRRGIEISQAEDDWRRRQNQQEEGPPAEPLNPNRPAGPVRDYFKNLDEERRRQEADELNKQHTVTIGEEPGVPRNTLEYYRRLRGIPDVEEEPASRYEGLPRNPMEAGREDRPYEAPKPTGPVILPTQEEAGGGAFARLMAQLRGERGPGGPGLPADVENAARAQEAQDAQQTAEQQAAERALRDARLDEETRRAQQERAYEQEERGKQFVRKFTRGFGREEAAPEPLKGPVLEVEPEEPAPKEPEAPEEPVEADKEETDRAKRAAAALRHAREGEAEAEGEKEAEGEEEKGGEERKGGPPPMTEERMQGVIQKILSAMRDEDPKSKYFKELRRDLRTAQRELDRMRRGGGGGGGEGPKGAAPGGRPGRGGDKAVVIPDPDKPAAPGAAGGTAGGAPAGPKLGDDHTFAAPREVDPTPAQAKGVEIGKQCAGGCYAEAGRYVLRHHGDVDGMQLVHGTISNGDVTLGHSWVVMGDTVFDGVQGRFYDRESYYRALNARNEQSYPADEAVRRMAQGDFGPWDVTPNVDGTRRGYRGYVIVDVPDGFLAYGPDGKKVGQGETWDDVLRVVDEHLRAPKPKTDDDEIPPPTDPEGKGPGHAPIVGGEDELHVEGFPPVRFRYEVVEARNVVASHNPDFTPDPRAVPELQGRNRDRAAMIAQVKKIRSKMNPPLLFDAPSAVQGAPLIGLDWNAEGGNGRVIAVKGMEKGGAQYRTYIDALKARLARFGIDPAQAEEIENFDQPLLIRRRLTHIPDADRGRFAEATNADPGAHLSAGEKALADARRLTPEMLEHLTLSERGTLNTEGNLPFIRQFLASLPEADANDHSTKEGYLNDAGLRRLQNAVVTRAYVLGRELHPALDRMFESTDADVKTVQNGLLRAAPNFATYRGLVDAGELPFVDVMTPLLDAASTVADLRNRGLTIRDWFDQGDLLGKTPEMERAMRLYQENTSVPDLHDALVDVSNILSNLKRKSAGDLFGEAPEPPTVQQVFDLARDPRQAREAEEDEVRAERGIKQLNAEIQAARANGEYDKVERLLEERKALRDRKKPC